MYRSTYSWPRWVVSFTPRPFYPRGKIRRYPLARTTWRREKSCLYRYSNSGPSAVQPVASRHTDWFKFVLYREPIWSVHRATVCPLLAQNMIKRSAPMIPQSRSDASLLSDFEMLPKVQAGICISVTTWRVPLTNRYVLSLHSLQLRQCFTLPFIMRNTAVTCSECWAWYLKALRLNRARRNVTDQKEFIYRMDSFNCRIRETKRELANYM
jgi:hypothetical protein